MKIKTYLAFSDYSLKKTLSVINKNGQKCCVIVDKKYQLIGTLSDGDIRKSINQKINLDKNVLYFCNKKSKYFVEGKYNNSQAKNIFLKERYDLIPVVNKNKKVKKILLWQSFFKSRKKIDKKLNIKVVVMAGGKGTRLNPLTKVLPKPLVPIKDKPIVDHIMENFMKFGINDFFFTIKYKMEIIKAYFKDRKSNFKVRYLEEKKPLGTAGGLKKLYGKVKTSFFVTNCDVLVDANLVDFFNFHKKEKSDLSIVVASKKYNVPYGVCQFTKSRLDKIVEKPKLNYFVNAGLYLVNPIVLKLIPKNKYFDMNNLIKKSIEKGLKVSVYPIPQKNWTDIGQLADYKKHLNQYN